MLRWAPFLCYYERQIYMAKYTKKELIRALIQRFIMVKLDDGTMHSGYIGNAKDFKGDELPENIILVNGLMMDEIHTKDIIDISFPKREETTEIPIIGQK